MFCMWPGCQPAPPPSQDRSQLLPHPEEGCRSRPTSTPGFDPEASNVTSGGTHRATMLCFLRLNQTHIHTHLGRHTHLHTQTTRERVQSSRANVDQNQLGNTHSTHGTNWNLNGLHWQKSRSSWRKHRLTNETLTHKHAKAVVCHSRFEPLVKNRRKNSNSTVKQRFSQQL